MTQEPTSIGELATRHTLSIDHQLALRAALRRLTQEFSGQFNAETVERFLAGSYEQFASRARFPHYVHLLAERYARLRLVAFAEAERHLDAARPIVLFVCRGNDLHSPMARSLFARQAGDSALAWSAGLTPRITLRTGVEEAMHKVGISLIEEYPKPIAPEMLRAATTVVTFGCEEECPIVPGRKYLAVGAPEPPEGDGVEFDRLRDWLEVGTASLLATLR